MGGEWNDNYRAKQSTRMNKAKRPTRLFAFHADPASAGKLLVAVYHEYSVHLTMPVECLYLFVNVYASYCPSITTISQLQASLKPYRRNFRKIECNHYFICVGLTMTTGLNKLRFHDYNFYPFSNDATDRLFNHQIMSHEH